MTTPATMIDIGIGEADRIAIASITEADGVPTAEETIADLVAGHEAVTKTAGQVFTVASGADDESTSDLLTQRLQVHEKTAWMLRSMLG